MIRFSHACVAGITGVAFALGWWLLVPAVAAVLGVTRLFGPRAGMFNQLYVLLFERDAGWDTRTLTSSQQFAQLMSFVFLAAATVMFLIGHSAIGWTLTLIVTALATLAATTQICVGCLLYEQWTN